MITHMRLNIDGALRQKAFAAFTDERGNKMPANLVKKNLQYELAMGRKYMPVGKCDNFDPVEHGCLGHHDETCLVFNVDFGACDCGFIKSAATNSEVKL